jgi:hypothetical protein
VISSLDDPREYLGKASALSMYAVFAPVIAFPVCILVWIFLSFSVAFLLFCASIIAFPSGLVMQDITGRRDKKIYTRYYNHVGFLNRLEDIVFKPYKYVGSIKPETLTPKAAARYHEIKDAMTALGGMDRHGYSAAAFAEWEPKYLGFLHLLDPHRRADAFTWEYPNQLRDEILSVEDSYIPDAIARLSAYLSFLTALRNATAHISGGMSDAPAQQWYAIAEDAGMVENYIREHVHIMRGNYPPASTPPQALYSFYQQQLNQFFYGEWKHLKDIRRDLRYTLADLSPDVEAYDRAMEEATHHPAVFHAVKANPSDWYTQYQKLYEPLKAAYEQYLAESGDFIIGTTANTTQPDPNMVPPYALTLTPSERTRHMYVIGRTGSGKTTFLKTLIAQDLRNTKQGVIVISPENRIFEDLLALIPPERANDLIYFDPTDTTPPVIGFNPFALEDGDDLNQKAQETYTIFERALGELGVKMTTLLQNAAYALIQQRQSKPTDLDLLLYPADNSLRHRITRNPSIDERTRRFWDAYDSSAYYKSAYEPVVNRLDPFFRPPHSIVLSTASFSWHHVLNERPSIIFCNLSRLKGMEAQIMGQLIIAQIQQTIFRRDPLPEDTYIDYSLYIDEFQTYAQTSEQSFIETLNKARKYHFGLTLAHQVTSDIPPKLLSSIVGNVGTVVCLQLSAEDAPFFTKDLQIKDADGHASPAILQNLALGTGIARTPDQNQGILFRSPAQPPPLPASADRLSPQALKTLSKTNYGTLPTSTPEIVAQQPILSEPASPPTHDTTAPAALPDLPAEPAPAAVIVDETENPLTRAPRRRGRPPKSSATPSTPRGRPRTTNNGQEPD